MKKNGIMVAGTILVDKIKEIENYPSKGQLEKILSVNQSAGGCVPNVGIDLKVIDKDCPVYASGKIGSDAEGVFLKKFLSGYDIDTTYLVETDKINTSFTDVMSICGGERTFFTYPGASSEYGYDDIDFENFPARMLHLAYFLLLDKVDNGDGVRILRKAKEDGIKTSIDLVSENSERYSLVAPCLPFVDNLIVNEIEASCLAGIDYDGKNIFNIAKKLYSMGVNERVIIHMPDKGVCYSGNEYTEVNSFVLPENFIKGATGAGDAFCAGALMGIYKGFTDKDILEFASSCAVVSLRSSDAVSAMMNENEIKKFCKDLKRR